MYWDKSVEIKFEKYSEVADNRKEIYFTKNLYEPLENLSTGLIRKYWMKLKLYQFQDLKEELIRHFYLVLRDNKIDYDKGKAYSYLTKTGYHKLLAKKMKYDNENEKYDKIPIHDYDDSEYCVTNGLMEEIEESYEREQDYDIHTELENIEIFLDKVNENPMNVIKLTDKKMNSQTILLQKEILGCLIDLLKNNLDLLENVTFLGELYEIISETTDIRNMNQIRETVLKLRQSYKNYNENGII